MFTGIIEKVGQVLQVETKGESLKLFVRCGFPRLEVGESVSVNGVCLTVVETDDPVALFYVGPETLRNTHFSSIRTGDRLNLERALTPQSRLSGHIVQGHVDGVAQYTGHIHHSDSYLLSFQLPEKLGKYCIPKGSIAINGISLTLQSVSDVENNNIEIKIMIIPHTWKNTNLSYLKQNDLVNIETDLIAKYVERLCQT